MDAQDDAVSGRLANRLGALAVRVDDAVRQATGAPQSLVHAEALNVLSWQDAGTPLEVLRRALGLSQPGATHVVSRLMRDGLARRERDSRDWRVTRVWLTARGRDLVAPARQDRIDAIRALTTTLTGQEQAELERLIDKVLRDITPSSEVARRTCRRCDPEVCEHPRSCPVTAGARSHASSAGRA